MGSLPHKALAKEQSSYPRPPAAEFHFMESPGVGSAAVIACEMALGAPYSDFLHFNGAVRSRSSQSRRSELPKRLLDVSKEVGYY